MQPVNFEPKYLTEEQSREYASRRMLSFLAPPYRQAKAERGNEQARKRAPSLSLFSLDALPEGATGDGPAFFNWKSRDLFDVDGRLLFRDLTIDLGSGNEWRVRTAASDLLRTPVWSLMAGPALEVDARIAKALAILKKRSDLEPVIVAGEKNVRLVCHAYPKLGILFYSRLDPEAKFIIDIGDWSIIPVKPPEKDHPESSKAIWSLYDFVSRGTIIRYRALWEKNVASLPSLPKSGKGQRHARLAAQPSVLDQRFVNPELRRLGQQSSNFCAAATAKNILEHHRINKSQNTIARRMNTGPNGATPEDQVNAIPDLSQYQLVGCPDPTTSFSEAKTEIVENRPFKTGNLIHARACGGYKVERGDQNFLYIYDPYPANQGRNYFETWEASRHVDYMYVRPDTF